MIGKSLTYVEIDLPYCGRTYGVAPCTAAVGVTGPIKCFNSRRTCQDRPNYLEAPVTLRFAVDTDYLPPEIDCIPAIQGVEYTGQLVSLGENLGQRASITISFRETRHSDAGAGFDKYLADRTYSPFNQGSFWGKFRARHPYLRGVALRLIRGFVGQTLAEMESRLFVIEMFSGPNEAGHYTIVAKDPLKLADNDRAKCPALSLGYLSANITAAATSATLAPTGVGNADYPASGKVAIGGREICSFTRVGDVLTLTRAQDNTVAVAHNQEDRVQLVRTYSPQIVANIIHDLLVNYADVPAAYITLSEWQAEVNAYLQRNYSAIIAEPTGVNQLVSELIEQAALVLWWDDRASKIRLQVIRSLATDVSTFDDDSLVQGSLTIEDQPDTRISQVWTYFGQRNPLEPIDRKDNFRSTLVTVDLQTESDYGSPSIKEIFSRWIPTLGRTIASRVNAIKLARFKNPPRRFSFEVWRDPQGQPSVSLGGGYQLGSWILQDATGASAPAPVQVIELRPAPQSMICQAEEFLFSGVDVDDPNIHNISVDVDTLNVNLRTLHDTLFSSVGSGVTVNLTVSAGAKIGSANSTPALDVGSWPAGVTINIIINGRIQGRGGNGGLPLTGFLPAPGFTAIYTRYAINVTNNNQLWGGGGGGSGNGSGDQGGGGAGYRPGNFGGLGGVATDIAGGASPGGGGTAGGGPGLPGVAGGLQSPGAAGNAVDGSSFCTFLTVGDRRGGLIN